MEPYLFVTILLATQFVNQVQAQSKPDSARTQGLRRIEEVLIDSKENVHIIYSSGENVQITHDGRCEDVKLNKNKQIVGWVHRRTAEDDNGKIFQEYRAEIMVFQRGHDTKVIPGDMTIWNWKFWSNGKKIAFGTGPLHGNCIFKLYDLERGHMVEECNKLDSADCPAWAKGL